MIPPKIVKMPVKFMPILSFMRNKTSLSQKIKKP
jgi:hypothetical protein